MPASPPNKRKTEDQQDEPKAKRKLISTQVAAPLKRIPKVRQRKSELTTDCNQNEQNPSKMKDEILEDTTNQLIKEKANEVINETRYEMKKEQKK